MSIQAVITLGICGENLSRLTTATLWYLLCFAWAQSDLPLVANGAGPQIHGKLYQVDENNLKKPVAKIEIRIAYHGSSFVTSDFGEFYLTLPKLVHAGDQLVLEITNPGWIIQYPLSGKIIVPRDPTNVDIEVWIVPESSPTRFSSDQLQEMVATEIQKTFSGFEKTILASIEERLRPTGKTPQEILLLLEEWKKSLLQDEEDSYKRGLAYSVTEDFESTEKSFLEALRTSEEDLHRLYEIQAQASASAVAVRERAIISCQSLTAIQFRRTHFEAALSTSSKCLEIFSRDHDDYKWAELRYQRGVILAVISNRSEGRSRQELGESAVAEFERALEVFQKERFPFEWAWAQASLGKTLVALSSRMSEGEAIDALNQAEEALKAAMGVFLLESSKDAWISGFNYLAEASLARFKLSQGPARLEALNSAIQGFDTAELFCSRMRELEACMLAQARLGVALFYKAGEVRDENLYLESIELLRRAVEATEGDLKGCEMTLAQGTLGEALVTVSQLENRDNRLSLLNEAIGLIQSALSDSCVREDSHLEPDLRASLAAAMILKSKAQDDKRAAVELIEESIGHIVVARRLAVEQGRERAWVGFQVSLGDALRERARLKTADAGSGDLLEAKSSYESALVKVDRDSDPILIASIHHNIGGLIIALGPEGGQDQKASLIGALSHFLVAREFYDRAKNPEGWARTQYASARVLQALGRLEHARAAYKTLLEVAQGNREVLIEALKIFSGDADTPEVTLLLSRAWLRNQPGDQEVVAYLLEASILSENFSECVASISDSEREDLQTSDKNFFDLISIVCLAGAQRKTEAAALIRSLKERPTSSLRGLHEDILSSVSLYLSTRGRFASSEILAQILDAAVRHENEGYFRHLSAAERQLAP